MSEQTKKKVKRIDPELREQIKAMEAKQRDEAMKSAEVTIIQPDGNTEKMSFDQWWMVVNKKVSMKSWMKEILWADFKSRGLSKMEPKEKFDRALDLFGIKQ